MLQDEQQTRLVSGRCPALAIQEVACGGCHTLVLSGELDIASEPKVAAMVRRLCAIPGTMRLTVDLRKLTFIDSSGLRAMCDAKRICTEYRVEFRVIQGPENVRRAFEITGLTDALPFIES